MIETTLCLPLFGKPPSQVLLALKKRGFGQGKITGVGGKLELGESPAQAALRELAEEIGIHVQLTDLQARGRIDFFFPAKPSWNMRSHLFVVQQWVGTPTESDEVAPAFYPFAQIPSAHMWDDARHWLPPVLAGQVIQAHFVFGDDLDTVVSWEIIAEQASSG